MSQQYEKNTKSPSNSKSINFEFPNKIGRYVIVDTETTGILHPDDHILEIAAIEVVDGKLTGAQFHGYISPRKRFDPKAIKAHGMTEKYYHEYLEGTYLNDRSIILNFLKFIGNSMLVAHNSQFDARMINRELEILKLPLLDKDNWICTMKLFRYIYKGETDKANLEHCCQFLKFKLDQNRLHSAIYDAFLCARLFCKMLDGKLNESTNTYNINKNEIDRDLEDVIITKKADMINIQQSKKSNTQNSGLFKTDSMPQTFSIPLFEPIKQNVNQNISNQAQINNINPDVEKFLKLQRVNKCSYENINQIPNKIDCFKVIKKTTSPIKEVSKEDNTSTNIFSVYKDSSILNYNDLKLQEILKNRKIGNCSEETINLISKSQTSKTSSNKDNIESSKLKEISITNSLLSSMNNYCKDAFDSENQKIKKRNDIYNALNLKFDN